MTNTTNHAASHTANHTTTPHDALAPDPALGSLTRTAVATHSYATLATTSAAGRPHAAGVVYQLADGFIWISTIRSSRKARNVAETGFAALSIPARRIPVGPPSTVQFQGRAEVVDLDDHQLRRLAEAGRLKNVTGHGELDLDGGCFLKVAPPRRVPIYGLGMSLWAFVRDPLGAARLAAVDWT